MFHWGAGVVTTGARYGVRVPAVAQPTPNDVAQRARTRATVRAISQDLDTVGLLAVERLGDP